MKPEENATLKKQKRALTIDDLLRPKNASQDDVDDREIARLEALLGFSKKSARSKGFSYGDEFAEDGLDGMPHCFGFKSLLAVCSSILLLTPGLLMDADRILAAIVRHDIIMNDHSSEVS